MKKLLMMIGAAAVAVGAYADTWTDPITGIVWTYSTNNDGVSTVTLGGGTKETPAASFSSSFDVNKIPWTFTDNGTTYAVTRLASYAFYTGSGDAKLTGTPTFPSTLTSFGYRSFYNKTGLNGNLVIPDAFSGTIAEEMFWNNKYTTAIIGSGVTQISAQAFRSNSELTAIWVKGRTTVASGSQPATTISMNGPFRGCKKLKVALFGRNTSLFGYKSDNKMFQDQTGDCLFFAPKSGIINEDVGNKVVPAYYGQGEDLDIEIDEQAKLLTATVASASALTNVLNAASTFKSAFGLDTKIAITNRIAMTGSVQITEEMLQSMTLEAPPWYLTFQVTSQAELDNVLAAVSVDTPIIIDIEGAGRNQITVPDGRKVAILAKSGWTFGRKQLGLTITFY